MIRVLVADDHAIVRRGLKQILTAEPDMSVVGEARDGNEALEFARRHPCDVVVLDVSMPGPSGLEVLKDLKRERPKLPVLVLSIHPEDQLAIRVLKAGGAGYMTKETAPEELVTAVRRVVAGGRYVSSRLAEKMAIALQSDSDKPRHETLSDREYEVMCLIASGKSVSEIAAQLALSVKTISTYRSRILEKMDLPNNAALTHYAIQNRLVE
ncbi:MAG TPA: response regulator transcription factor [Methylomirabilota bacterium]|jgi:DNA-binding NarL/FixJ family response regulator